MFQITRRRSLKIRRSLSNNENNDSFLITFRRSSVDSDAFVASYNYNAIGGNDNSNELFEASTTTDSCNAASRSNSNSSGGSGASDHRRLIGSSSNNSMGNGRYIHQLNIIKQVVKSKMLFI
jgi:hypothetical protein